jgi:hypothetical protein
MQRLSKFPVSVLCFLKATPLKDHAEQNNSHSSPHFDKSMNFANYSKKHTNIIFAIMMIIVLNISKKVMLSKEQESKR